MEESINFADGSMILERTRAGQCELLSKQVTLCPVERRLLAMLTGFTPLSDLSCLLGEPSVPQGAVKNLFELGLVRPAKPKLKPGQDVPASIWVQRTNQSIN